MPSGMRFSYPFLALLVAGGCTDTHSRTDLDSQDQPSATPTANAPSTTASQAPGEPHNPPHVAVDSGIPAESVPVCPAEPAERASVKLNGTALTALTATENGEWLNVAGREVFRLRFLQAFDPEPGAADDEFTLATVIDIAPSAVAEGRKVEFDQQLELDASRDRSYENDDAVRVRLAAGQTADVRRVLVEVRSFFHGTAATSYRVHGTLSLNWLDDTLSGALSLALDGGIPHQSSTGESLTIQACFAFDPPKPSKCMPGEHCGNDCYGPEDYVCGACGELRYTHDCVCRPDAPPLPECDDPEPAAQGALCGEYWWCNRACAPGLQCKQDFGYGRDLDAGIDHDSDGCTYFTCQPE